MPQFLSQEAQFLLRQLFKRNPANRLGKYKLVQTYKTEEILPQNMTGVEVLAN